MKPMESSPKRIPSVARAMEPDDGESGVGGIGIPVTAAVGGGRSAAAMMGVARMRDSCCGEVGCQYLWIRFEERSQTIGQHVWSDMVVMARNPVNLELDDLLEFSGPGLR